MPEINLESQRLKLKQIVDLSSQKRFIKSKTWELDMSRLAFVWVSDYVYLQQIPWSWKNFNIDIILDVSHSMTRYSRINKAILSVQNLIKMFYWIIDFRIIVFWITFTTVSYNTILSIDANNLEPQEIINKLLPSSAGVVWDNLVYMEWWDIDFNDWTNYSSPLLASAQSLSLNPHSNNMIILLTDWQECIPYYSKIYSKTNWINSDLKVNQSIKFINDNWISLLPIWIDIDISYVFKSAVNITNYDLIFNETIKFLEQRVTGDISII